MNLISDLAFEIHSLYNDPSRTIDLKIGRKFPNGNELHFIYVNGEAEGEAVLIHGDCKEEFKFVAGQKEVHHKHKF